MTEERKKRAIWEALNAEERALKEELARVNDKRQALKSRLTLVYTAMHAMQEPAAP